MERRGKKIKGVEKGKEGEKGKMGKKCERNEYERYSRRKGNKDTHCEGQNARHSPVLIFGFLPSPYNIVLLLRCLIPCLSWGRWNISLGLVKSEFGKQAINTS